MKNDIDFKNHSFELYQHRQSFGEKGYEFVCKNCGCFILKHVDVIHYRIALKAYGQYSELKHISVLKDELSCDELVIKSVIE